MHPNTRTAEEIAEADSRWSGCLDGSQYSEIESALADLHAVEPADLIGSDLLTRLYRAAKACAQLRTIELAAMDEEAAEKDRRESEDARLWQRTDAGLWA